MARIKKLPPVIFLSASFTSKTCGAYRIRTDATSLSLDFYRIDGMVRISRHKSGFFYALNIFVSGTLKKHLT